MKKALKIIIGLLFIIYLILLIYHIRLLFYCQASIITTLLFYIGFVLVILGILNLIGRKKSISSAKINNWRFSIVFLFILLFMVELVLKYSIGNYQSYSEKNGGFYYYSMYKDIKRQIKLRNSGSYKHNYWIHLSTPNSSRTDRKIEFEYLHTYNSFGFRDKEVSIAKDTNEYRIIGLGDSFTEGVGTHQDSTYLKVLERILIKGESEINVTTINAGRSGSDPFYEYMLMEKKLLEFNPDLIILTINNSDIIDITIRGGSERFQPKGMVTYKNGPNWEYLYASSYIIRHFMRDILGYNFILTKGKDAEKVKNESIQMIYNVLIEFQTLALKNGFDLLVVLLPHYYELTDNYSELESLGNMINDNDSLYVVDLYQYYKKTEINRPDSIFDYFWQLDFHHTPKGYEKFAEGVAEEVIELDLIQYE